MCEGRPSSLESQSWVEVCFEAGGERIGRLQEVLAHLSRELLRVELFEEVGQFLGRENNSILISLFFLPPAADIFHGMRSCLGSILLLQIGVVVAEVDELEEPGSFRIRRLLVVVRSRFNFAFRHPNAEGFTTSGGFQTHWRSFPRLSRRAG